MRTEMAVIVAVFCGLLGAALGSYLGVASSRGVRASLAGRSRCDSCARELRWFELVPLVSYPALGGHCRSCRARVGLGVYAWEVGGALAGLAVAIPLAVVWHLPAT